MKFDFVQMGRQPNVLGFQLCEQLFLGLVLLLLLTKVFVMFPGISVFLSQPKGARLILLEDHDLDIPTSSVLGN